MDIQFDSRLEPSSEVLFRELKGESVLLDLKGEYYYGLDEVGTRVWQLLGERGTLDAVLEALLEEYDVEEDDLRRDLSRIASELLDRGLVTLGSKEEPA